VLFMPLPIGTGYGCSWSVASNVFAIANLTFTCKNQNNALSWMRNPNRKVRFNTFLSLNEKCSYLYYKLTKYSIDSLAHACALLKAKLPTSNFRLLAIFVTDGAIVNVGFAGTRPTSKSVSLSWRVKSKLDACCRTNDHHTEHRHLYWLRD
jgi:hypothetical protein